MKQFCILFLCIFFAIQLWGQEPTALDKVTLKTGEVYVGKIVLKTDNLVLIRIQDGTRYQFPLNEVKQIEELLVADLSNSPAANTPEAVVQTSGSFSGQVEVSGGISDAKYAFTASPNMQLSLTFGNKKMFGKDLFLGVGTGYNNTFIQSTSAYLGLIPIFLRLQSTLTKDRTAPYIGMDAGYAFSSNPDFGGGALVKVSLGVISKLNYNTALILGVYAGLNSISGNLTETNNLGTFTYYGNTMMQNVGVKFGLQF